MGWRSFLGLHFGPRLGLMFAILILRNGSAAAGEKDEEGEGRCKSGRLFLGSLSESNAEYIPSTGIYQVVDGAVYNKRTVYKHIAAEAYIYYQSGRNFGQGFWAVGPQVGSQEPVMSLPPKGASHVTTQQEWRLWNPETKSWDTESGKLKLTCVDADFFPCTSGKILLGGISQRHAVQNRRMGIYVITNRTYSLRPVYKHREQEEFLFYTYETGGKWVVGPEVGKINGGLFVSDHALRPEFIFQTWVVFSGRYFLHDQGVTVQCYGISSSTEAGDYDLERPVEVSVNGNEAPDAGDISKLIQAKRNPLISDIFRRNRGGKTDENENEICEKLNCQNGGRCANTKDSIYLCICNDNYFGVSCQSAIECGPVPSDDGLQTVSSTGNHFLDVTFYRCPAGRVIDGPPGVVCQVDGSWSETPRCLNGHRLLTPEHHEYSPSLQSTNSIRSLP